MAALEAGVFSSKSFVFVIGENLTEFLVHPGIIAKQSKALDVLINGPMTEALNGKAILDDVQADTFERFCQFAYTGNYTTPTYKLVELPSSSDESEQSPEPVKIDETLHLEEVVEVQEPEVDNGWGLPAPKKSKKPTRSRLLRLELEGLRYEPDKIPTQMKELCSVRHNASAGEDYTPVFLGHAHLYVFADKYGVTDLKNLALFKLHQTLLSFTPYVARRPDVVELVRYAYENTPDRVGAVDELRELLKLYTGCEAEHLVRCPEFLSLIGEGGEIPQDFVRMIMKRIV